MTNCSYLMENDEETLRLELKTDPLVVEKQAKWAGLESGMRAADIGCGSGKTTYYLNQIVKPDGAIVGVDISESRIAYAKINNSCRGITYERADICQSLEYLGEFDFIWLRFLLEYHQSNSRLIVKNLSEILKPGGIICLIDLDYNCLTHYGLGNRVEKTINAIMQDLEKNADFDPFAGRKLYSYLYDLGYQDINIEVSAHHLIYGELNQIDKFNWTKKIEVAKNSLGYQFDEYEGGYEEFYEEFIRTFSDSRRFIYTPVILCRGQKPLSPNRVISEVNPIGRNNSRLAPRRYRKTSSNGRRMDFRPHPY